MITALRMGEIIPAPTPTAAIAAPPPNTNEEVEIIIQSIHFVFGGGWEGVQANDIIFQVWKKA
jgi:hypothetical protein